THWIRLDALAAGAPAASRPAKASAKPAIRSFITLCPLRMVFVPEKNPRLSLSLPACDPVHTRLWRAVPRTRQSPTSARRDGASGGRWCDGCQKPAAWAALSTGTQVLDAVRA